MLIARATLASESAEGGVAVRDDVVDRGRRLGAGLVLSVLLWGAQAAAVQSDPVEVTR
jgi:hypothetical protein